MTLDSSLNNSLLEDTSFEASTSSFDGNKILSIASKQNSLTNSDKVRLIKYKNEIVLSKGSGGEIVSSKGSVGILSNKVNTLKTQLNFQSINNESDEEDIQNTSLEYNENE